MYNAVCGRLNANQLEDVSKFFNGVTKFFKRKKECKHGKQFRTAKVCHTKRYGKTAEYNNAKFIFIKLLAKRSRQFKTCFSFYFFYNRVLSHNVNYVNFH